uniref:Uncharacterized protein n=1 Tax=Arundo donax TaxID=35708 RepID=A0A0A9CCT2_ARUDO
MEAPKSPARPRLRSSKLRGGKQRHRAPKS